MNLLRHEKRVRGLKRDWKENPRWRGIERPYSAEEVVSLRGGHDIDQPIARHASERLWDMFERNGYVPGFGAATGNQAVQYATAGIVNGRDVAIYASGWQVAADANDSDETLPDMSLYPVSSVPRLVRRINNALLQADHRRYADGERGVDWLCPIIADGEAGFGSDKNVYELTRAIIEAGAAAVHFEDQLASYKKCGHMGGKVLVPEKEHKKKLLAARFAADVMGVPTVIIARTDANAAGIIANDIDANDQKYLSKIRTDEGFYKTIETKGGLELAIARGLAYAPYADLIWCETAAPDVDEAAAFAEAVHKEFPGKMLAYNCSPSFNWAQHFSEKDSGNPDEAMKKMRTFQQELSKHGYKFQFITLIGYHLINQFAFKFTNSFLKGEGMAEFSRMQEEGFALAAQGYEGIRHQEFVGTRYFDAISKIIGGSGETSAYKGSTEEEQFHKEE